MTESAEAAVVQEPPSLGDLNVHLVTNDEWRVRDIRLPENDARGVLGFVEKTDGGYRAMQLGHGQGVEWSTFPSLADALGHFTESNKNGEPWEH